MSVELSVAAAHASHVHPTGASARHEPGHDGGEAPGATRSRGDDGATTTTLSPGVERRAEVARRIAEIQGAAAGELDPRHDAATASGGATGADETQRDDDGDGDDELTPDEQRQVAELRARDAEVRAHEQAHAAAAGAAMTSGPSFTTQRGPDGKDYAVGGEVGIAVRDGRTPDETMRLARQAMRAALAPSQPSGQDRRVAARAQSRISAAQREMREQDDDVEQPQPQAPAESQAPARDR